MRKLWWIPVVFALGCSSGPSKSSSGLTYYKDIKPLVEQKCLTCHTTGNIAPFPLTSYDEVMAQKTQIRIAVANRIMPPWMPGQGCNQYAFDRSLTDDQISTITGWIDSGAAEGDPSQYVAPPPGPTEGLSRVDRTLTMAAPYTPKLSPDEYRCFVLDWPETTTKYVSGFRARPGTPAIVHHVIAYLAQPSDVATFQQLDAADPDPGYTCFGGPGGSANAAWIGTWTPGTVGGDFAPSTGIKIPVGAKVILQVHYNTSTTAPEPDQTSLDFKLDDTVAKEAVQLPFTDYVGWVQNHQMDIPAGQSDVMHSYSLDPTQYLSLITNGEMADGKPLTIYGVGLHMHTHGTHARLDIVQASGTHECLLDIPHWDFHWQGGYGLSQPTVLNPGDQLYIECHWDNSTGTTDLNWGEGTGDEMCLGGLYITE